PVWHTDIWRPLSYARWILQHRTVPATEPLLPLAQAMPFVDIAWLSQLIGYGMFQTYGIHGIQFLSAACVIAAGALLAFSILRRTGNSGAALLTLAAFYWGTYQQILVVRPQ